MKLWTVFSALLLCAWALGALPAEAACTESRIEVLTRPLVIGPRVPVTWQIAPACDVIETSLLLGTDPSTLEPVGERIFGVRSAYQQVLSVGESRGYWIAAYALDEDGNLIHSAPRLVPVLVPPERFSPGGPHGSHGAPPSYVGTDTDFLQPAGEPHFASLRRFDFLNQFNSQGHSRDSGSSAHAEVLRLFGSTNPEEVLAGHTQALTVGGESLAANAADVSEQIGDLTRNFIMFNHPRPGFYVVNCSSLKGFNFGGSFEFSGCFPHPAALRRNPSLTFLPLEFDGQSSITDFQLSGVQGVGTSSTHTTATYFIPARPPGRRLVSAKLRLFLFVFGDPSPVRINGKAPERLDGTSCSPFRIGDVVIQACEAIGRWDFTEEAAALAEQGGGQLTITADPIPLVLVEDRPPPESRQVRAAQWFGRLEVNYPWSHGDELGALTLSFQQACPKDLKVIVTPNRPGGFQQTPSVLPSLPGTSTVTDAVRNGATMATVDVMVKSCPPEGGSSPASVVVDFSVQGPSASDEAGGHTGLHTGPRPTGTLDKTTCVVMLDSQGMGSCDVPVTYRPSEASGIETIIGRATDFPDAVAKVRVEVPGLVNLADIRTNFFRLTGQTTPHPDNHWGTEDTFNNIQLVALDFFDVFNATLGVNDMSLRQGGLFDICGTWNPADTCANAPRGGHKSHRTGTSVDIDRTACVDQNFAGACTITISVSRRFIADSCFARGKGSLVPEASYHCEWSQ